jgi:arabinofuranosyltransferase
MFNSLGALGRLRLSRASLVVSVLTPSLLFAYGGYLRRWAGDDGFINLRVVQQLLSGNGFVYNAGERCEAVTSAAWVLLLWLLGALGCNIEDAAWIASLALGVLGVALAAWGAALLSQEPEREPLYLPFGALAYVAIPVAWDYATSALENGLGLAYLGASYFTVARAVTREVRARWAIALLLGVGPLVRPDYALYAAPLTLVLVLASRSTRQRAQVAVCAALPGLTFQIFRMGYFAALVPNTAIAKEAFEARWDQGFLFLDNTVGTYALLVPLLSVLFCLLPRVFELTRQRAWLRALLPVTFAGAGVLHLTYVVRVGGDFMHGRMLLPGLFAIFSSVSVLALRGPLDRQLVQDGAAWAVLAIWACVCAGSLRVEMFEHEILDERRWYSAEASHPNPVRSEDYRSHKFYAGPLYIKGMIAEGCERGLAALADDAWDRCRKVAWPDPLDGELSDQPTGQLLPLASGVAAPDVVAVYAFRPLGLSGRAMGLRVNITDSYGLADPLAARGELLTRGRPGHEKQFSTVWFAAKYIHPSATRDERVRLAKRALSCGLLRKLQRATHEPLTVSRFLTNMRLAFPLHGLRVPADPQRAVDRFCGS